MRKRSHLAGLGSAAAFAVFAALFTATLFTLTRYAKAAQAASPTAHDPWPQSQLLAPKTLAAELQGKGKKPRIVCVGFPFLYQSAHIPGAASAGPAREAAGLVKLKQWARGIPHGSRVIIYCGCCPFKECPNIRPAYEALHQAGFTNIQVLALPANFITDWMDKGYPIKPEK